MIIKSLSRELQRLAALDLGVELYLIEDRQALGRELLRHGLRQERAEGAAAARCDEAQTRRLDVEAPSINF